MRGAGPTAHPEHGDDADDGSPEGRALQVLVGSVAAIESTVQVDVDHGAPAVGRQSGGRAIEIAGRIVDQDIECTKTIHRIVDGAFEFLVITYISTESGHVNALARQRRHRAVEPFL